MGELEVDGDERIGEVFHSIKKCLAQMNKKDESYYIHIKKISSINSITCFVFIP